MQLSVIIHMLIIWQIQAIPEYPLNMDESINHLDEYCLSYHKRRPQMYSNYILDSESKPVGIEEMWSYCLRSSEDGNLSVVSNLEYVTHLKITFAELKEKNISTRILLSWSASLDVAERYKIFLDKNSNSSSDSEVVFYNCTETWFGPACRFIFEDEADDPFDFIVNSNFRMKGMYAKDVKVTCYMHLTCQTSFSCLDWREICDGKRDCVDGRDEEDCWQLERNECAENEYRCQNGQCIPWEYYKDGSIQPDCFDGTDEQTLSSQKCALKPGFECEEHACRPGEEEFACGDGQCIDELLRCTNRRDSFLPNNFCTNATLCFLKRFNLIHQSWCSLFCPENNCLKENCSMPFEFRRLPLLLGHVRFIVSNVTFYSDGTRLLDHICYNATICPHLPPSTIFFDELTCHHVKTLGLPYIHLDRYEEQQELVRATKNVFRGCLTHTNQRYSCNSSTMYQCMNSPKCISKSRLVNSIQDCPEGDDETYNQSCSLADIRQRFKCINEREEKCLTILARDSGKDECVYGEDEYIFDLTFIRTHISFQTVCDGITHLLPLLIDGQNETDETRCELWQCNNTYTRCDGFWTCNNGADEVDCSPSTCSAHHHDCVLPDDLSKVSCLPLARAGDGIDDCIGGTDEPKRSASIKFDISSSSDSILYKFRCRNDTTLMWNFRLCDGEVNCPLNNDDELFCNNLESEESLICRVFWKNQTDVEKFLCDLEHVIDRDSVVGFKLTNVVSYPSQIIMNNISAIPSSQTKSLSVAENRNKKLSSDMYWICNRGIPFRARMPDNTSTLLCLCPPSYYGDRCQYQNQRVSLILQIQLTADWRHTFVFLLILIDEQANIESHEHVEYVPGRDCPIKYNLYLIYASRPKNSSKNFSVRIDAFSRMTLNYRASWIFPLRFAFLPVYHLTVLLRVPFATTTLPREKCSPPCIHGQCSRYVNDQNSNFCHCESGWSGLQCNIQLKCSCASNSICLSDSICLCPPGRSGRRCYLSTLMDGLEACLNGGERAPVDGRYLSSDQISSVCICPEGFSGDLCEQRQEQTQIDISFHPTLPIPSSLSVHFIAVRVKLSVSLELTGTQPNRTTIAKKLQFDQSSLTVYTPTSFNIAIAQMFSQYYLIILREAMISAAQISTQLIPTHRCRSIGELFNNTFANQHLLKRIKSYHRPCQIDHTLICFFDEVHMCLCTLDHTANCLEFDHKMTYECEKAKYCGNDGQCFQDAPQCPTSSFCACHRCYFGSRCQFSTKGSTLSLDIILGYHIQSKINIQQQPTIVKIAILLTSIVFVVGMINGFLSLQTFRREETRNVGCGLYLFAASILSMIIVVILTLKLAFLLASQMGSIEHRWFLRAQCITMDFLLRSLLSTSDWLSACVALERLMNAIQGVKFNKTKSQRVARWMILIIVLSTSCSYIYDPVHRQLLDDEEEQRTWCVTQYSSSVQILDWTMNIFHFSIPFVINAISAVIVVLVLARSRSNSQKKKSFKEYLNEQFHQHKHLFISPVILVILALPRLVLSFLAGCMGSARESWLYLSGYYISFIPAIMTLIVFILPSELYKTEFYKTVKRIYHH